MENQIALQLALDRETGHMKITSSTTDKDELSELIAIAMKNNKDFNFMVIKAIMFIQKDIKEDKTLLDIIDTEGEPNILNEL
jgi:hypothetical protein